MINKEEKISEMKSKIKRAENKYEKKLLTTTKEELKEKLEKKFKENKEEIAKEIWNRIGYECELIYNLINDTIEIRRKRDTYTIGEGSKVIFRMSFTRDKNNYETDMNDIEYDSEEDYLIDIQECISMTNTRDTISHMAIEKFKRDLKQRQRAI